MGSPRMYATTELLHDSPNVFIFKGYRTADQAPVVLKALKAGSATPRESARLKHEYAIARSLDVPGVAKAIDLVDFDGSLAIVMQDNGGRSLDHLLKGGRLDLKLALRIAVAAAGALSLVHQRGVIHKDIKPHNILVRLDPFVVELADFGISTRLSQETPRVQSQDEFEGTLAYMSPEQTGWMNRPLDYRTDLYSFGVLLYEMLTGTVPFTAKDPMEYIHCHLARTPEPPNRLAPGVPSAVAAITMKLLAKAAEDRYQHAYGVKSDLEECLRQLEATGKVEPFTLARRDVGGNLRIPHKLYGREREIGALMSAFERAGEGAVEVLFVSGHAGIGKSALVNEVHKGIARRRGHFISGKFGQLSQRVPYAAVSRAFGELCRHLMAERPEVLASWRAKLLAALGPNGQVIIDVIPELAQVIGPQPSVPSLGPTESQNRFNLFFQRFVRVFTGASPLVLFLDDLQWADPASLKLLKLLLTDPEGSHLLVIGAYRQNEVDVANPFSQTLKELREARSTITEVALGPLSHDDVSQLLIDALACDSARAKPLADIVLDRAGGNPFFIGQFLRALCENNALRFDSDEGAWVWSLEAIRQGAVSADVVELVVAKIRKLAPATQRVLKLASCVGHQFDLRMLSILSERTPSDTALVLWEALAEGLILPLTSDYRFVHSGDSSVAEGLISNADFNIFYRFLHDRVQQAAYSRMVEDERARIHLRIGRVLLDKEGGAPRKEALFDIVSHLNVAAELIDDQRGRTDLARLNLSAGRRAKVETAFEAACGYLSTGASLLTDAGWGAEHDLLFDLYAERAECEYLSGRYELAESLFTELLSRARSKGEAARVHNMRMILYNTLGRFPEALEAGLKGLSLFGIDLPRAEEPLKAALGAELSAVSKNLGDRTVEDVISAPEITNTVILTELKLLADLFVPAYFLDPILYTLVAAKMVNLSLRHGSSELSSQAYVSYGFILTAVMGRHKEGYEFGKIGLDLNEIFHSAGLKPRIHFLFAVNIVFSRPLRDALEQLALAYRAALEVGDFPYLSYTCNHTIILKLALGEALPEVNQDAENFLALTRRTKDAMSSAIQTVAKQMIACLEKRTEDSASLSDGSFEEAGFAATLEGPGFATAACWYYTVKLELFYLSGRYEDAFAMRAEAEKKLSGGVGQFFAVADLPLFTCLTLAALPPPADGAERERRTAMFEQNRAKLAALSDQCPENYWHKHALVMAEKSRVSGDGLERMLDLYDRAIAAATESGHIRDAAIANELCAKFLLAKGRGRLARSYLKDAEWAYQRWGATAKVDDLQTRHSRDFSAEISMTRPFRDPGLVTMMASSASISLTGTSRAVLNDAATVLRAAQTIAGEMALDKLMAKLMKIVLESVGGQRGALILDRAGGLRVEALIAAGSEVTLLNPGVPIESADTISGLVVQYVATSREAVILANAAEDTRFLGDPYIVAARPKSILATPMVHQGRLTGVLYLENNAAADAFSPGRLEFFSLLATQATIAIENALLYTHVEAVSEDLRRSNERLETIVTERTEALRDANERLKLELTERERAEAERAGLQEDLIRVQSTRLAELSTPLIPITNKVMVMPLVGTMDRSRAHQMLETTLKGAQKHRASVVIIDITGVRIVDSDVATTLIKTAAALRLLGTDVVLTGIRAEVARTLSELEIDLRAVVTQGTLQKGIAYALKKTGEASMRLPGS